MTTALPAKRLLVVDDEEGPRESLNMIFCDDFDVTIATSGEEAIEFSTENPFDVVITDIRMRGMSGIDVLREVKKIDVHTEVIVLTAYETLDTARQAISFGASEYLIWIIFRRWWTVATGITCSPLSVRQSFDRT